MTNDQIGEANELARDARLQRMREAGVLTTCPTCQQESENLPCFTAGHEHECIEQVECGHHWVPEQADA